MWHENTHTRTDPVIYYYTCKYAYYFIPIGSFSECLQEVKKKKKKKNGYEYIFQVVEARITRVVLKNFDRFGKLYATGIRRAAI